LHKYFSWSRRNEAAVSFGFKRGVSTPRNFFKPQSLPEAEALAKTRGSLIEMIIK